MAGSYIVAGARTPIGKMSGALSSLSAADLGGHAIAEALARSGVRPDEVDHVIMGQVLMAGQGRCPAVRRP
jgi:acetyl-CoA C-acetyltransferase